MAALAVLRSAAMARQRGALSSGSGSGCGRVMGRLFSSFSSPPSTPPPSEAEPSTNLFVSGLSKRTTSEGLKEAFSKFGQVIYARVVTDRNSGYSKGFGFVRYSTLEEAAQGITGMHGKFLDGWVIFAEYARPRQQQPMPPSRY